MSFVRAIIKRGITTSAICNGKRNFKKFPLYNKRGTRIYKEQQRTNPEPEIPIYKRGVKDVGYHCGDKFVTIPEMVPELIVPDLTDFKLKPYVSYRTKEITQSEFTTEDLFNVVYAQKISEDFKSNKLNADGTPKEPSKEEKLTPEEAKLKARQTGTDIF